MKMTNEELDRRVAELQGWKVLKDERGVEPDYWVNGNVYVQDYHPSTNWYQAGELMEKYRLMVFWQGSGQRWIATYVQGKDSEDADDPRIAIVKAVIALLESEE